MLLSPSSAGRFIDTYMAFLGSLVSDQEKQGQPPSRWLVLGRARYDADRSLLTRYRATLAQADDEILDAIAGLKIGRWVYLKDTRNYSVLIADDGSAAYGVLGLTDRLRVVAQGESGVVMKAGLFALQGHWICDGLIENMTRLGPSLRRDITAIYQRMRNEGKFSLGAD